MSTSLSSSSDSSIPLAAVAAELRAAGCVFAEEEARLLLAQAETPSDLERMVRRRVGGLPLEQVLGWAGFCGLRIAIDPGVFVPRRRTELLVREAARLAGPPARREARLVVVDLCCGSGALGAALAALTEQPIELHAADIDPAATQCARRNLAAFGDDETHSIGGVYQGDLYEALPDRLRGRIDILLANVPYVPTDDIALLPMEARDHEPRVALDGGGDGLAVMRAVAAGAAHWLAPGGHLLAEAGERQVPRAVQVMTDSGLIARVIVDEDTETTAIVATRPGDLQ